MNCHEFHPKGWRADFTQLLTNYPLHGSRGSATTFNHFHQLLGGEPQSFSIDAAPLFKPVLARWEIQLIAACTPEQYRRYIECDASIQRRMQEIRILSDQELQQR